MSNVIPMGRVSISDFARSALQIETERSMLDERSVSIWRAERYHVKGHVRLC